MAKATKSTKKFQSKHLKHTIQERKRVQEHNKKIAQRKGGKKGSVVDGPVDKNQKNAKVLDDVDVEEYFEKDDKLPEMKKEKKQTKKQTKKQEEAEAEAEEEESSSSEEEVDDEENDIDMDALAKDDPEFYNYLKNNDKDLLDFNPVNPLDAISDEEEDDDEEEGSNENGSTEKMDVDTKDKKSIEVGVQLVKKWSDDLKSDTPSIKTLKNVVIAYKSAINSDSDDIFKYTVKDEKAFKNLMFVVLQDFPLAVQKITPFKVSSNGIRNISGNKKKVAQLSTIIKVHTPSLITLLEDASNTETCALVLQSVQELLPYLISFRKLLKAIVNSIVLIWSSSGSLESEISAFAWMNNACKEYPKSVLEIVLRSTYANFLKNCGKTSIHTTPLLNFQKNSAAELFGLNPVLGYQIGFEFIRQLAIHLRTSVNAPTKDSYKAIYNWKFCHGLDFWSRVISVQVKEDDDQESQLKQLIYPLVQVTIGTIKLIPTAQFFPLRFYLIRSLIRLSQSTGVYIPLFPLLSEILHSSMFSRVPKRENLPAIDFESNIKVNKAYLNTRVYVDGVCEELIELIGEYFVLYCKSAAYPELTTPPLIFLRRSLKKNNAAKNNAKFNRQLNTLIDKLTANSKYIEKERSKIEYGPKNKVAVSKFLQDVDWKKTPLGAYIATQRLVKEEKLKLLRESLEADAKDAKNGKKTMNVFGSDDEIEIDEEDDDDEDDE
ncbi:mRNA-binding ribosome synthesis protein [Pichia kluyveri]|uniref:mRNA-binding ribosome synthesis protein n=1 Tax=Pichia kluyveri TaxID=36015 RepID=A0AAV5RBN2_PICKL|nr:mRNA-binding ribosome synthesis protein [Pichia kluyveri]